MWGEKHTSNRFPHEQERKCSYMQYSKTAKGLKFSYQILQAFNILPGKLGYSNGIKISKHVLL